MENFKFPGDIPYFSGLGYFSLFTVNPSTGQIDMEPETVKFQGGVSSLAFSPDDSHVISGWRRGVWIWNLTTNKSTRLSERIQLPDGTRVHSL